MIEVTHLSKKFGSLWAVDDLSFSLKKGEIVGFLGPNAAGKTTTMRLITGYLAPSGGSVTVAGHDVQLEPLQAAQKIGYLPETTPLYGEMVVVEYLSYFGRLRGLEQEALIKGMKEVSATCGLTKVLSNKIANLSRGFKQRVGLASALLHRPEILILDEPTVGLDPNQIDEIRKLIREIGSERTVLLSTHILSEVEQVCQRVLILADGKLAGEGTLDSIKAQARGKPVYSVGFKAARGEAEEAIRKIAGFESLEVIASRDHLHHFRVTLADSADRSEEFFRLAVAKGFGLCELKKEEVSLEDVFRRLTQ